MMVAPFIMLFIGFYLMSFLMVMSSDDWFLVWLGLEVNMMSFILIVYFRKSMSNIEVCLKYFFVQSLGSVLLMSMFYLNKFDYLFSGALILSYKMGGGPFFYWFPIVCNGISWVSCFMLMTFQKVIPMMLMSFFMGWMLWSIILISLIVGMMGSFNQIFIKKLMAFSSIHHMGWMLLCMVTEESAWVIYLLVYAFVVGPVVLMFLGKEINGMLSLVMMKSNLLFIMMIMSLSGMPPFLGFFLKWISFYFIIEMDSFIVLFMVFMSVCMFYVYLRFIYGVMMKNSSEVGWSVKSNVSNYVISMDFFLMMGILLSSMVGVYLIY